MTLIMLCSCELFQLRDAEPASEDALWNEPATTVSLALENLRFAYEDSRNAVNYSRLFHQDYRFYFAAQDISDFSTDAQWNRAEEQDMILNLHSRYKRLEISLIPLDTADEMGSSEARIYRKYVIKASADAGEGLQQVQGNLELHYIRQDDRWLIHKWYDYRSGADLTWGVMKYENR